MKIWSHPLILMAFVLSVFCSVYMAVDLGATPQTQTPTVKTVDVEAGDELVIRIRRVDTPPPVTPPVKPPVKPPVTPAPTASALTVPTDGSFTECAGRIAAGGTITVLPGVHECLSPSVFTTDGVTVSGQPGAVLAMATNYATTAEAGALVVVEGDRFTLEGVELRGCYIAKRRGVKIRLGADSAVIRNCDINSFAHHGVDCDGRDAIVERCRIHHMLWWDDVKQLRMDAHGIVLLDAVGMTIRDCVIWNCSGDSIQADRGVWDSLLIENCELTCRPLEEDRGGYRKGANVGENAFDSKTKGAGQHVAIVGCRISGFGKPAALIREAAGLNLKEAIDCEVRGCTITDCENAVRVRFHQEGYAIQDLLVQNCTISAEVAFRIEEQRENEDKRSALYVDRCTIDSPMDFEFVGLKPYMAFSVTGLAPPGWIRGNTLIGSLETYGAGRNKEALHAYLLSPEQQNVVVAE